MMKEIIFLLVATLNATTSSSKYYLVQLKDNIDNTIAKTDGWDGEHGKPQGMH